MEFVNLTPHAITVYGTRRQVAEYPKWEDVVTSVTIPPSGTVARVSTIRAEENCIGSVQFSVRTVRQSFGEVTGLPEALAGVVLIVSAMVLSALAGSRPDVFAPDTGPDAIRENGQIVAVRGLVQ